MSNEEGQVVQETPAVQTLPLSDLPPILTPEVIAAAVKASDISDFQIAQAARTAHEVNRAYCLGIGDGSQTTWEGAPAWQRLSAISGVRGVIAGNNCSASHASWSAEKLKDGWVYGEVKDAVKKTHPCLVPYDALPDAQKFKDALFINTVRGVLGMPFSE